MVIFRVFIIIICFIGEVSSGFAREPLVLQITMSHPRNLDQTLLIFRKNAVNLVTNRSQMRKDRKSQPAQLGQFTTPLNNNLKLFKRKVELYHQLLRSRKKAINLSEILKKSGRRKPASLRHSHAPIIHLNKKEINHTHSYFRPLMNVLNDLRDRDWRCTTCVQYRKGKKGSIVRTVKVQNKKPVRHVFSRKDFKCRSVNKTLMECVDPEFGLFETAL